VLIKLAGFTMSDFNSPLELLAAAEADAVDLRDEVLVVYVRLPELG
jgi:hypothetical protein